MLRSKKRQAYPYALSCRVLAVSSGESREAGGVGEQPSATGEASGGGLVHVGGGTHGVRRGTKQNKGEKKKTVRLTFAAS